MAKWISVRDTLPKTFDPVLVARPQLDGTFKVEQGSYHTGGWWKVYGSLVKRVSYWMPMPKPPGKEGADG